MYMHTVRARELGCCSWIAPGLALALLLDRHLAAGGTDCSSTDRDTTRRDIYALLQGWDCTLRNQSHSGVEWNSSRPSMSGKSCPREEGRRGSQVGFFLVRSHSLCLSTKYVFSSLSFSCPSSTFFAFSWGVSLFCYGNSPTGGGVCHQQEIPLQPVRR